MTDERLEVVGASTTEKQARYAIQSTYTEHPKLELFIQFLVNKPYENKYTPIFDQNPYKVVALKGNQVTAEVANKRIKIKSSFFKKFYNEKK